MKNIYHIIYDLLKGQWVMQVVLLLLVLFISASSLLSPYIIKIIIDQVFPSKNYTLLIELLFLLTACYLARVFASYYSDVTHTKIGISITNKLRLKVFDHIIKQPLGFFHKNKNGALVYKLNNQIEFIESFITGNLIKLIDNIFTLIGISAMLIILNYHLFLGSIVLVPLLIYIIHHLKGKVKNQFRKATQSNEELSQFFYERLKNVRLIKLFNTYKTEEKNLDNVLVDVANSWTQAIKLSSFKRNISTFIIALSPLIVFGIGGKDIINGTMTIGALVAFLQYLNRLFTPISDLTDLNTQLIKFRVAIDNVYEVFDRTIENQNKLDEHKEVDTIDQVIFRNMSFSYKKNEHTILSGINLSLNKGKSYALIGLSGCGKSTLLNIICKLYPVSSGELTVNGENINDLTHQCISEKIALVTQESLIFYGSFIDNIRYGTPDATYDEVVEVCTAVGLLSTINNHSKGFDAVIGHNGDMLSGGQKQRLSIARALLRKSDMLILDEATSALDSLSEKIIIDHVKNFFNEKKLLIIISHRYSSIKHVDEVIYLKNGKIVQVGSPAVLSKNIDIMGLFQNQLVTN